MEKLKFDFLIIGGGIAGVTAAETIRAKNQTASIGIINEEEYPLYSRVSIPTYCKKKISREKVFLRKPEDFTNKRIDLYLGEKVSYVDTARNEAGLENGRIFTYEKLLISAGGKVKPWSKAKNFSIIYRLQTIDDADNVLRGISSSKKPVVIGSSFICLEFAEIAVLHGLSPRLLVKDGYFFSRHFDERAGEIFENNFKNRGVSVSYKTEIMGDLKDSDLTALITNSNEKIIADFIGVGVGIDRNLNFLQGSGLEISARGVVTDQYLKTNQENVYAAGDICQYEDVYLDKKFQTGNWTSAFLQGRRAGLNMTGEKEPFKAVASYSITNLGLQITVLGDTQEFDRSVSRVIVEENKYERFFLKRGRLVGASLINMFQDKPHISLLISEKVNLDNYQTKLKDPLFDIRDILKVG